MHALAVRASKKEGVPIGQGRFMVSILQALHVSIAIYVLEYLLIGERTLDFLNRLVPQYENIGSRFIDLSLLQIVAL